MAISPLDLKWCYAQKRDKERPAANGGRPSSIQIASGVEGNIWPSVTTAQRVSGITQAEKVFCKNANLLNEAGMNPWMALSIPNKTDEYEYIIAADQDKTQDQLTGSERRYTASSLGQNAIAGSKQLVLTLDHPSLADCYQAGDGVVIYNSSLSLANTSCVYEIVHVDTVSTSGSTCTLQLATALQHSYQASNGLVAGVMQTRKPFAPWVDPAQQSGTGTYDFLAHPLVLDNIGTIRQDWTLTYNDGDTLNVTGDTLGSLGNFSIAGDIAPQNTQFSKPYFTLDAGGHGSAHVNGDTITFSTYASMLGLWWFKVVPPNCGTIPLTNSKVVCMLETG